MQVKKQGNSLICEACNHSVSVSKYRSIVSQAKAAVYYGYQYRKRIEYDKIKYPNTQRSYALKELNDAFTFIGTAVVSGVLGNLAYDAIKEVLSILSKDPLIIEIEDAEFQRLLKSERQQAKFIKYIQEYRNNNIKKVSAVKQEKTVKKVRNKKIDNKTSR